MIANQILSHYEKNRFDKNDFTIISNNCWGSKLYNILGLQYLTPFVGLYIYAPCYLNLLQDFKNKINMDLSFTAESKYFNNKAHYPIGLIDGNIEIHFLHYDNVNEAQNKWSRRKKRMMLDEDRMFFKIDDRDHCNSSHIESFHHLPFKNKISFTSVKYSSYPDNIYLSNCSRIPDGLKLFNQSFKYFDVVQWINSGKIVQCGLKTKFFYFVSREK